MALNMRIMTKELEIAKYKIENDDKFDNISFDFNKIHFNISLIDIIFLSHMQLNFNYANMNSLICMQLYISGSGVQVEA